MKKLFKHKFKKLGDRPPRWIVRSFYIGSLSIIIFALSIYIYALVLGAPPLTTIQNTIYYSQDGTKIGEELGVVNRYWVDLEEINPTLIDATLQAEDQNFHSHHGFDLKRILAAVLVNIKTGSMKEGASTITQQYARNLYLSHEKTWSRKIKEAFYTIRLEIFYSKDELLEGYLNTIYYGHGAYGIETASQYFFEKESSDLTLAEATLLAGIPNSPSYYSPINHYDQAKERQQHILSLLAEEEMITEQTAFLTEREDLQINSELPTTSDSIAPYFQDIVLAEMEAILEKESDVIRTSGYHVYTTLDETHQEKLDQTAASQISESSALQIGGIAMDPSTGAITGLIGGKNYSESPYNRAVQAKRMVGSTFKPFLYYSALTNGYTAATTLMSKPTTFVLADGSSYQPSNYNGYYADKPVTLAQALAVSDNIYAVKTNIFLTPKRLIDTTRTFGITSELEAVPSLALGTASISVKEMVTAYSMLANGGNSLSPHTIEKITDSKGKVVYQRPKQVKEQVLDPQQTFILNQLMTGMFNPSLNGYMHVTGESIVDQLHHTYAGKSGTTETDSWMIGYSPQLVMGVWTGYDDNRTIDKTIEQQAAKQIWADFMEGVHTNLPVENFEVPAGIVAAYIDPTSGELATPYCENKQLMYFVEGTVPEHYCSVHRPEG
ncbi:transglycosylase domain-containing protein [Paraliobacillus zengyii]|uniref:transglycosylase domain-containing protein n=1 Tax=Paraliobacillus zengyii TaxID=2213194 RepID=UPI000E3C74EB|nr:transglycosylase domain-containing protein [Paraliobacillus zengyii]